MYNEFYGFSRDPFLIVPDPNYLYMSPKHEEALARLVYGIKERRAVMLLTGEVGAGKTTLIRYLVGHLPASVQAATIANSNLFAEALLRMILAEFGRPAPPDTDKSALIRGLQAYLEGLAAQNRRGLLIIDEAQNLPLDALEEIRMLSNFQVKTHSLVQILLVGQPELRTRMKDPRCLQIAQRVALNYHITALNPEETRAYITYRLKRSGGRPELFTPDAMDMVFRLSRGIPRSINLTCDSALIYGFAEEVRVIDREVVSKAAKQLDLLGLVSAEGCENPAPAPPPAAASGADTRAVVEGIVGLESSLGSFMQDLKQEIRKFGDQADAVTGSATSLTEVLEKRLVQDRETFDRLHTDSAKLKLLLKLLEDTERDVH
ncbi:MAG: AAA family ATPase [Desulfobacterales bacterium]|jgi:general secretion pathway protein A|nr:AAA family ATPase [Desulfobacterales bacterium]